MNNSSDEEAQSHSDHSHDEDAQEIKPLLSVTDFNGDGKVDNTDVRDIIARYEAVEGEDLYHPLYDTNVNGEIDSYDIENVIHALGGRCPFTRSANRPGDSSHNEILWPRWTRKRDRRWLFASHTRS